MIKNLRVAIKYINLNLQRELIYKYSTLFTSTAAITYIVTFIWSLEYILEGIDSVLGYSYDELFLLMMGAQVWWFVNVTFARKNFQFIAKAINDGSLDMLLLKPVNLRALIPVLQFDFRHFPVTLLALALMASRLAELEVTFLDGTLAVLFFLNGVLMVYMITSIFVSLNFWVGRNMSIFDITIEWPDLIKLPVVFFPGLLQGVFTFLVPITLMLNPTFQILYGRVDSSLLIYAVLMSLFLVVVAEVLWVRGLKNYSSAN